MAISTSKTGHGSILIMPMRLAAYKKISFFNLTVTKCKHTLWRPEVDNREVRQKHWIILSDECKHSDNFGADTTVAGE
jgi:hypothetical protein